MIKILLIPHDDTKRSELKDYKSRPNITAIIPDINSVFGIGTVTAVEIIIATNEFKNIRTAKKFACCASIVPFEHNSGTSLRSRPRVSHKPNKRVKTLLHMAAMASLISSDMKCYFERKTSEGKNKMRVINAVRNKLITHLFSCVNNDRLYKKAHISEYLVPGEIS